MVGLAIGSEIPVLYEVIYADPPWRYDFSRSSNRKIENQYPTMTIEEICGLSIPAAKNSVLYLWATAPKLPEALMVMSAWGFSYKSHAVWDKEVKGMGYWFRGQHELLLVGTRGQFSPPATSERTSSIFRIKRSKHSKKPHEVRDSITRWFPDCKRVELFARTTTAGWDVWGNEIESTADVTRLKGDGIPW